MSGEDLIASWTYRTDAGGEGFVYIGSKGVYFNEQYVEWSRAFRLHAVSIEGDEPAILHIQYDLVRNSAHTLSPHVRKNLRVPIPPGSMGDAERVVESLGA